MNDNRSYFYNISSISNREEYAIICGLIPSGSKVIDLGCGDGTLLSLLKAKGIDGDGIDISSTAVAAAQKKGIKARQGRIDMPLPDKKNSFDYAISNVTLQMVMYPEVLLSEMKRIARKQIITFPNFASFPNRLDLLINGRMPRAMIPGYEWYSTGHIHQLSLKDFEEFCKKNRIKISDRKHIYSKKIFFIPRFIQHLFPNIFVSIAVYILN